MADFCKQCSIQQFGEDFGDLAGLCTEMDNEHNQYPEALCEGCGFIQVNYLGECVHADTCLGKHEQGYLFHKEA